MLHVVKGFDLAVALFATVGGAAGLALSDSAPGLTGWQAVDRYGVSVVMLGLITYGVWRFAKWFAQTGWPWLVKQFESQQARLDAQFKVFMESAAKRDAAYLESQEKRDAAAAEIAREQIETLQAVVAEVRSLREVVVDGPSPKKRARPRQAKKRA